MDENERFKKDFQRFKATAVAICTSASALGPTHTGTP
jgi:hypothetical protein